MPRDSRPKDAGISPEFGLVIAQLFARLHTEALDLGEPMYDLHHAKLQLRKVVKPPVILYWGVHAEARQVFIQNIEFLPRGN